MPRLLTSPLAVAALLLSAATAAACPFCSTSGPSLSRGLNDADFIVLGTLGKAQRDATPGADPTKGTTELAVEAVVKPHPYLAGKKTLSVPRFIPATSQGAAPQKILLFCLLYANGADEAFAGVASSLAIAKFDAVQLDAVRGEPVAPDSPIAPYMKGAFEVREKDALTRLKYFFPYLDHADLLIGTDAYNEFAATDYPEIRKAAPSLDAPTLRKWLLSPATPQSRVGLYALLLGHCGQPDDAALLRKLLDGADARYLSGRDGILAALSMLDPKGGYDYMVAQLGKPDTDFNTRYAVLKAMRFFWEFRPDLVPQDKALAVMKRLCESPDIADLPIEDLRKWKQFQLTDDVLALASKKEHAAVPITRRAILRFMLAAPAGHAAAKEYVERVRKDDPERVKFVEQTLIDEQPTPASDPAAKAKK